MKVKSLFLVACILSVQAIYAGKIKRVKYENTDTSHFYMRHSYDVLKYTLNFNLYQNFATPFPKSFSAKEVIKFRVDSTLSSIKLNAVAASLAIDSVGLAGSSFTVSGDTLKIQLNRVYNPGETAEVRICYKHNNVTDNAFYVSNGCVFTDFPPEGARKVFPCWDRPSDKALTDITAKVPLNVRLGSTGILADSTISGDSLFYHWVNNDPVATYLITLSSRNIFLVNQLYWHKLENPSDSIPVRIYYKSGENISLIRSMIIPVTNYFSQKFGDYPFEKIGFATLTSAFPWGGMENQTMVNLMPNGYSQEAVIAHEHSHQWFGDLITCGTWADIWLNEGFGTFCETLWMENTNGYAAYLNKMSGLASVYISQNPGWPIYNPLWALHTPTSSFLYNTAICYNKGACVLHQLRCVLGDQVFFNIMHAYAADTNFRFKNAVTSDFIKIADSVSGQDLGWFFDEWIYKPNHPVYSNRFEITDEGSGNWKVKFRIEQIQSDAGFFTMPVGIKIGFSDGTDTIVSFQNNQNNQVAEWVFQKQPNSVVFDPDKKIILKEATTIAGIRNIKGEEGYALNQNKPNPFGKSTRIEYKIPRQTVVKITVIDSRGKVILVPVNEIQAPGQHSVFIDSSEFSPGVYYYQMEAGSYRSTRKMVFAN